MTPDQPIPAADLSIAELDARMQAAGMFPLSEMLKNIPLAKWITHAAVKDMESFEAWLHMRRAEMLRMHATMDLDKRHSDDMYEWVVAHSAVFTEVLCNFQAALGSTSPAEPGTPAPARSDANSQAQFEQWYLNVLKGHPDNLQKDATGNYRHVASAFQAWSAGAAQMRDACIKTCIELDDFDPLGCSAAIRDKFPMQGPLRG